MLQGELSFREKRYREKNSGRKTQGEMSYKEKRYREKCRREKRRSPPTHFYLLLLTLRISEKGLQDISIKLRNSQCFLETPRDS